MTVLRSALYNAWFWIITAGMALPSLPVRFLAPHAALAFGRVWARAVLAGLGPLAGIRVEVRGAEHLPKAGPALIASQHQSAFDTLIWIVLLPKPAYVVKRELLKVPFYGPMLRPAGQIMLDRSGGGSAIRALVRETGHALAAGRQVVIFPEGTRMPPGRRGVLQPGVAAVAAASGLPVIPVATDSGRAWGRRAFRKQAGTIHIDIRPPLPAGLERSTLLQRLEEAYAGVGGAVDKAGDRAAVGLPGKDRKGSHSPD